MPETGPPTPSPDQTKPAHSPENEQGSALLSTAQTAGRKKHKSNVVKPDSLAVEPKSSDFNDRVRAFKRNVAKLHKAHETMLRRAEELEQRERELEARESSIGDRLGNIGSPPSADEPDIADQRAELELLRESLDQRDRLLDDREAKLAEKEADLAEKQMQLSAVQSQASKDDAERIDYESLRGRLMQRSNELAQRELDFDARQQTLQPDLDKLDTQRREFRKEQGQAKRALTNRESQVQIEEQLLAEQAIELEAVRDELDRRQEDLDWQERRTADRESALSERSQRIEKQIGDLERRTADLLIFQTTLDQREQDIALRDAALNEFATTLEKQSTSLDKAKQLIGLRRQRVRSLHEHLARVSRKLRKKRRGLFARNKSNTVSIGPDGRVQAAPVISVEEKTGTGPIKAKSEMPGPSASKPKVITAAIDDEPASESMTANERRVLIMLTGIVTAIAAVTIISYILAGSLTKPTWRATLVVDAREITGTASLTNEELSESLGYLNERGLRPAADVAGFRKLLAERLTVTSTKRGTQMAYLDHQPELATFILKGLQRGIQQRRGDAVTIVSAAAADPQPFDDPRWRITYVLIAIGLLLVVVGYMIIRHFTRARDAE